MYAFLFDGCTIHTYKKDENDKIIYDKTNSGTITAINFDNMIKTIFMNGVCAISPQNLKKDFGIIDKDDNPKENKEVFGAFQISFYDSTRQYKRKNKTNLYRVGKTF